MNSYYVNGPDKQGRALGILVVRNHVRK